MIGGRWRTAVLAGGLAAALAAALGSCNITGSCCSNSDCYGSNVCSVDCRTPDAPRGVCEYHCLVDRDCDRGELCNEVLASCGCGPAGDAGHGTCSLTL